eukprot:6214363-Pleurochrysis_carterae.AAC.3
MVGGGGCAGDWDAESSESAVECAEYGVGAVVWTRVYAWEDAAQLGRERERARASTLACAMHACWAFNIC